MPVSSQRIQDLISTLLAGRSAAPQLELNDYLTAIPRLDALESHAVGNARAGARRRRLQAGAASGRRRHSPPVDGRYPPVRPAARLEAGDLRPHRPRAGEVAGQGRGAARGDSAGRRAAGGRLVRTSRRDGGRRGEGADRRRKAGGRAHAGKHAAVRHRARVVEGQARRRGKAGRAVGQVRVRVRRENCPRVCE